MEIGTLYVEELRATMRGRFALVGAGVILLAVGCVATVGTQDTWLDGYGIIAYFLVPLAFTPLAAVFVANPRANRFVQMEAPTVVVTGSAVQFKGFNRWGDYSSMSVDPSDDCTFWYSQEYYNKKHGSTESADWSTHLVSFKFPDCN